VAGLNVVQTGGAGGQTSVFIRGTNSNHVKVLIDGIDVNDPSTPNRSFDFSQLQTEDLSRLQVRRGLQSGLYGADAIGGVISLVTKRGEGPARATAFVEGGSYGTGNQGGRISGSEGIFDYSFSVQHLRQAALPVTPFELLPVGVPLRTAFRHQDGFDQARRAAHRYLSPELRAALLRQRLSRPSRWRLSLPADALPQPQRPAAVADTR
jgi:vitamin B12 transporter